ncbi:MAG: hypothetical protein NTZ32_00820 [Planctomycetales bacterium]|nr:hypothetical protein [Planctomycetales bacterium]
MANDLLGRIEEWRRKLLDLTNRNQLVSCKIGPRAAIRLEHPSPGQVWSGLLGEADLTFAWKRELVPDTNESGEPHPVTRCSGSSVLKSSRCMTTTGGTRPRSPSMNTVAGLRVMIRPRRRSPFAVAIPSPARYDAEVHPSKLHTILPCDSSQLEAILAIKSGASLVLDGPPGTGKSQTIANVIAECLADGKTVLFVSEKAAALEVVKQRLDNRNLGDFALNRHTLGGPARTAIEVEAFHFFGATRVTLLADQSGPHRQHVPYVAEVHCLPSSGRAAPRPPSDAVQDNVASRA